MDDGDKYDASIHLMVEAWNGKSAMKSPISIFDSHQYTLRILSILKNELNTYSTTLLASSLGFYTYFFNQKVKLSESEIIQIASDFIAIKQLPIHSISKQPDAYRGLLLNVGGDMRSVLISLSECVLSLRFFQHLDANQQQSILDLAQYVYIPIAHRLGFYKIKSGMEDLVLSYREPEIYQTIKQKLKQTDSERLQIIEKFVEPIDAQLKEHGMKYQIKGRTKSIHSIYTKMQNQGVPFEKVFDLWAIRIVIDSDISLEKADCWHAFSVVTNLYTPSLSRMRDWITIPRENGYESLHITVETEEKRMVEVQIRTERMNDEVENGMAAHWRYKGGKSNFSIDYWLENIKKAIAQEHELMGEDSLRSSKFSTELFAFTPQGDLKKLNIGASILDFAFAVHTEVGVKCVGGIVNGKNVGIKHLLRNGDQVQILTSKTQKPSLDWLNFVSSNRAKLRIRKAMDEQGQREAEQGKETLLRKLKNWKIDFNQAVLDKIALHLGAKNIGDIYKAIYHQKIDLPSIKKLLTEEKSVHPEEIKIHEFEDVNLQENSAKQEEESSDVLVIDQLNNINYSLSKCCNPVPGDKIFGFVTVSKGISIHRINCSNATDLRERYPYRIINSVWKQKENKFNFRAEIFVKGNDNTGIVNEISKVINAQFGIPILSINLHSNGAEFQGKIVIKIFDINQLGVMLHQLSSIEGVTEANRFG